MLINKKSMLLFFIPFLNLSAFADSSEQFSNSSHTLDQKPTKSQKSILTSLKGVYFFGTGGVGFYSYSNTQYLNLGQVTNKFTPSTNRQTQPIWGFGLGYQWDFSQNQYPIIFDLNFAAYNIESKIKGLETPAVNLVNQADTLNYSAHIENWAWIFEPKIVWSKYIWQPYFLLGIGGSTNYASNYQEAPTSSNGGAVTNNHFLNHTTNQFAWEIGVGVQRDIITIKNGHKLYLAGEYRYMSFGNEILGRTSVQTTFQGLKLNAFNTNILDIRLGIRL